MKNNSRGAVSRHCLISLGFKLLVGRGGIKSPYFEAGNYFAGRSI